MVSVICNYPLEKFLADLRSLRRQGAEAGMQIAAGLCYVNDGVEILVTPSSSTNAGWRVWLQLASDLSSHDSVPSGFEAALYLGQGPTLGRAWGFIQMDAGQIKLLTELYLPGPGMHKIQLSFGKSDVEASTPLDFSRVAGALGQTAWHRLASLHFVIVGAGRSGGAMASILVREGVQKITLIDPDAVEPHNIAGGLIGGRAEIGTKKVEALGSWLKQINPAVDVTCVPASITHWLALEAVANADFIVSAVDHDSARLAAAWLAALFLKPLIDIGVGIFRNGDRREMGADIRLVWPGRCLLCAGGLRAEVVARDLLASAEAERVLRETPRDWRHERAGSLASLNALTAGVATRVIEDFIDGRITENGFWTRLQFDEHGRLALTYPRISLRHDYCCCSLAGLGTDGIAPLHEILNQSSSGNLVRTQDPYEPDTRKFI